MQILQKQKHSEARNSADKIRLRTAILLQGLRKEILFEENAQ